MINPFKRSKSAAVLGCGPAGLFATHALIQNGWSVTIFSRKIWMSDLYGCQYLHAPIPGLTDDLHPQRVSYRLVGEAEGYREKVYDGAPVAVSPETLDADHDAWDIRAAYARAWGLYKELIGEIELTPEALGFVRRSEISRMSPTAINTRQFDLIVNTVPLPALCYGGHEFTSTEIWAMGDAPAMGQYVPFTVDPFSVVCNGDRDTGWYRASNVFGYKTVEWPIRRKPPLPGIAKVSKPLRTNCNCYSEAPYRWVNVGRYGSWTKGVLSHSAYEEASKL